MKPFNLKISYQAFFNEASVNIVSVSRDINLWSISDGKKLWKSHPFSHPSNAIFSPNNDIIAVKNTRGHIKILNIVDGLDKYDYDNLDEGEGSNIIFSKSGNELIYGTWSGYLIVRDVNGGLIIDNKYFVDEMITDVCIINNSNKIISMHQPKAAAKGHASIFPYYMIWDWPLNSNKAEKVTLKYRMINCFAVSPCGKFSAFIHRDSLVELIVSDIGCSKIIFKKITGDAGSGKKVIWSKSGNYIAIINEISVEIWDCKKWNLVNKYDIEFPCHVDFSINDEYLVLGSWKNGALMNFAPKKLLN